MNRGLFIALEGLEGSGKSSVLSTVQQTIESSGVETYCTREPGGTPIGEQIRNLLLAPSSSICDHCELMLMAAARAQLCTEVIQPKLSQGVCVITDRFSLSTIAYQGGGRNVSLKEIAAVNAIATGGLKPDLTLLLDVDVRTCLMRMHARGKADRIEQESLKFFNGVRAGYLLAARSDPSIKVIDSNGSLESLKVAVRNVLIDFLRGGTK